MICIKCRLQIPLTEAVYMVHGQEQVFFFHETCVGEQVYESLPPLEGPNAYHGLITGEPKKDIWVHFPDVSTR